MVDVPYKYSRGSNFFMDHRVLLRPTKKTRRRLIGPCPQADTKPDTQEFRTYRELPSWSGQDKKSLGACTSSE